MTFAWCKKCRKAATAVGHYWMPEGLKVQVACHGVVVDRVLSRRSGGTLGLEHLEKLFEGSVFTFLGRR